VVYLVAVHLLFAGIALRFLLQHRIWVLVAEIALVTSLVVGVRLVRGVLGPLELIGQGAQFLKEGDLTTRLRGVGQPEIDALVGVYNAMAERLRDERIRLEEQHHFLTQLLEVSPSGLVILDLDDHVEFVNPAALRLLGPAAVGQALSRLDTPVGATLARLGPGLVEVVALPGARRIRCRRGSFMDRGVARGFFQLEELTEELRRAEKSAYEKLIRMMAHEVNNSVGAANSLLHSSLNYAPMLPEEHRQDFRMALEVVIGRTEQLGALMSRFAEVVRLPSPRLAPCDLPALLRDTATLMRPACEARRVEWRWDLQQPPPLIAMDRTQIEQVLLNVVKNALEAIGEDGVITVRVGRRAGRPFVIVEDTGPGLSAEASGQLFTPFFTTKDKGQGIGLTLVQQILDQHHFEYALDAAPGGPTQFTILF
jgi:nitrogen fixation/metabolism regulation signal transduction histidine kinase